MPRLALKIPSLAVLLGAMTVGRWVAADSAEVCIAAYEKSQILRKQQKLLEAQDQLLVCNRPECPELARTDCSQWMREVQENTPSVVVNASDAQGHDLVEVRVLVDGIA